jgi:hypothetical protein
MLIEEDMKTVFNRVRLLLLALPLLLCTGSANAQGTFEFLGSPREVPDQLSPRHGIRYNTQGYDEPHVKWQKKLAKMQKKNVPEWALNEIQRYPGSRDAIGNWIDDAFDQVMAQFAACGGDLAERAKLVTGKDLYVKIMPSAFYEPFYQTNVAGAFYYDVKEIRVLNIYYTWGGEHKGWLRHARDLLVWEMGNYIAFSSGVMPEPRPEGWPCTAPPLKIPQ